MLKNYFIVAIRKFWRDKIFSFINIIGLSIGISAALVIFLIVSYDLGFDHVHKDGGRIYRVTSNLVVMGENNPGPGVTQNLASAITGEITGADNVVPLYTWDKYPTVSVTKVFPGEPGVLKKQSNIVFTNTSYFKVFNYTWLTGKPQTALTQPYECVLTETGARRYFPGMALSQVTGNTLTFNDTIHTIVTSIVKDVEQNTDFTFNVFISTPTLKRAVFKGDDLWNNNYPSSQVFVKLSRGEAKERFEAKLNRLFKAHYKPSPEDNSTITYGLQPLADLHFNSDYGNYFNNHLAHKPSLIALLAIAAFILLLACINFINLTTAKASQRTKEIGIRKTMGSSRKQLVIQFLGETFMLTFIATLLSIILTPLLLKLFADFIPPGVHFNAAKQPGIVLFLLLLAVIVTLLSGFYPAVMLSSYKAVLVLKNNVLSSSGKTRSAGLRKTLTVTQFVIAQVFIIATIIVGKQISYSINSNLGFKKDAIIYFNTFFSDNAKHRAVLLEKLKTIPQIAAISLSSNPPSTSRDWSGVMKFSEGKKEIETDVEIKLADTNYLGLYNLQLLAGNNLKYSDTANSLLINTTYLHALGFTQPQQAIGKFIQWHERKLPVVGVVADFHQKSLHDVIQPLLITNWGKNTSVFNIALMPQDENGQVWKTGLASIEEAFKQVYPQQEVFEYSFVDDTIAQYYETEKNISRLLMWATGIAILISSLGLLALVIYITNQRTKEIGIRKIVGANVAQIITLLSKDFLKLILLAFIIAVPAAWWGANKWLENFAYKTSVSWWVFGIAGMAMLAIAFLVLLARTYKTATGNPVKSLRVE